MQASASAAELKHLLSAKTDHLNSLTRLKWKFRALESFLGSPLFVFCQALHFLTNTHYNWLWHHTASCCNKCEFEVFQWACASLLLMSAFCGLLKPKFSYDGPGLGSWLCSAAHLMYSSEWKSTLWDSEQNDWCEFWLIAAGKFPWFVPTLSTSSRQPLDQNKDMTTGLMLELESCGWCGWASEIKQRDLKFWSLWQSHLQYTWPS